MGRKNDGLSILMILFVFVGSVGRKKWSRRNYMSRRSFLGAPLLGCVGGIFGGRSLLLNGSTR